MTNGSAPYPHQGVASVREYVSSITNSCMQAVRAEMEQYEGIQAGLRDSRKLREAIHEIVAANFKEGLVL